MLLLPWQFWIIYIYLMREYISVLNFTQIGQQIWMLRAEIQWIP
jgi:hypothetical protein